jgi:hypothetical protein
MMNDIFETDPATSIVTKVSLVSWPAGDDKEDWTNLDMIVDSDEHDDVTLMYTDNDGKRHDMGVYSLMALKSAIDRLYIEV